MTTAADPDPAPDARPARSMRRAVWTVVALAGLAVLGGAFLVWRKFLRAPETIAEHAARVPGETAALAAMPRGRPALVEPAAAGEATAVVAAFLAAVETVPEHTRLHPWDDHPLTKDEQSALVAAHPGPLEALAPLLSVPSRPAAPPDWDAMSAHVNGPIWLAAAYRRALEGGDAGSAARIGLLAIAFGREISTGQDARDDMVGCQAQERGAKHLLAALRPGSHDVRDLRRMRDVLLRIEESRVGLDVVLATCRAQWRREIVEDLHTVHEADGSSSDQKLRWLWSKPLWRADFLAKLDALFDEVGATVAGADADAPAAVARLRAVVARREKDENSLVGAAVHGLPSWLVWHETARAWIAMARAGLAVAEATAARGKVPASLDELVPEFLPAVPIDPWSGKPLRYEAGRVWSVGRDGVDDGGTPPADPEERNPKDFVVPAQSTR